MNHLLGGNTLKLVYDTYGSSMQTLTSEDTQVNVSRSITSLRSVFMSLDKTVTEGRITWCTSSWNTFYITMAGQKSGLTYIKDSDDEIQNLQLIIGPKLFPETGIRSHAECFYNLRTSLGVQANRLHAVDIKGDEHRNHNFVVGFDTECMLGLAFTGCTTKNRLMTIKVETKGVDHQASRMHLLLVSQQILEVSDSGVTFLIQYIV